MRIRKKYTLLCFHQKDRNAGFTLVEIMISLLIMSILFGLAVPVFSDSREMARRNACNYGQRQIESALVQWKFMNDLEFVTGNCLPGDGEAYIALDGSIPGEPQRSLADFKNGEFDCTSNGGGKGQVSGCDYITDGYVAACLTDNSVGTKLDGTPFKHDKPLDVSWKHVIGVEEETGPLTPLGDTFNEITAGFMELMRAYYQKYGKWPATNNKIWAQLGLNPDDWADGVNGTVFTPSGDKLYIKAQKGYKITVKGLKGKTYTLTYGSGKLVCEVKTGKWYYNAVNKNNEVDISTMTVTKV